MITKLLNQAVTYWAPGAVDAANEVSYASPAELIGRWEDKQELFVDANGDNKISRAVVYLSSGVLLTGYLFLGISVVADPQSLAAAFEIKAVLQTPSIDGDEILYKIWL